MRVVIVLLSVQVAACAPSTKSGGGDTSRKDSLDTAADAPAHTMVWPPLLSQTGLYDDIAAQSVAEDVLPFSPAWPQWSDGESKERYFRLPPGTQINTADPDLWTFPLGTRAWKTFLRNGQRMETRFIERQEAGWMFVAYLWREDGTDADAVPDGVVDALGTAHDVPDQDTCYRCHHGLGLQGIGAIQQGEDNPEGQLEAWTAAGMLSHPITESTAVPGDAVEKAALGYLHGNCGACHIDSYYASASFLLRTRVPVGAETPADTLVMQTAINAPTRHETSTVVAISPGNPEASQVYERMGLRGNIQMPPIGTEEVDVEGLEVVARWIEGLAPSE